MKTYVLTISTNFPKTHRMSGELTNFDGKIRLNEKLHTIRSNYELWKKRFEKIDAGKAVLSVRQWVGKPYAKGSTQTELFSFDKSNGIGIERLGFKSENIYRQTDFTINNKHHFVGLSDLAHNDGLTLLQFKEWFKNYDVSKPMAIIHFTKFRYAI